MRRLFFLATRIALHVALTAVLVFWVLSRWTVVLADVGSNSVMPRGVAFTSSPRGIKFSLLDRAWITNGVELCDVNESPSGWDWDAMQRPYARKWSLLGISFWYRTRQCLAMIAVTYPAAILLLLCAYAAVLRVSSRYARQDSSVEEITTT